MSEREKAQAAIDILSGLIIANATQLGAEQHRSGQDVDGIEANIASRTYWVKLRAIRERLENLITGVVT